ncbi:aldo/keto reductase [Lipingzhangella sp. LS1_29]|uniref:Aldo/keto reductase n=1 Tax=Lipingzhangella rawalii TaxID=2055835 RepID=A0ABU2HBB2_9ACTN|nr:aldo/keto reductase [Lipingzhangella rawalii]MDS1272621.1 aldo/keto reductase [Lipingzhangella rawalii]
MTTVPEITLNNGVRIPQLGFGVWQVDDNDVVEPVRVALEAGYRSIDTAAAYGNERGVGQAIAESGVPREELFVTSKLWNSEQGYDRTLRAFDATLERLKLDYLDMYLIHWPLPARGAFVDTWKAFERLYTEGRIRAIGVSNFTEEHLRQLPQEGAMITPAVNQVELHPRFTQEPLRRFHADHGIATEAWSPLGQGTLLEEPTIAAIAANYGKTPAQAILRWHIQRGTIVIPKSVTPERIRSNIDVFDFSLAEADVERISGLNTDTRIGPDPRTFDYVGES